MKSYHKEIRARLFVSVSGGKTSMYMARRLQLEFSDHFDMVFIFANTGQETEETLRFVDRCDREWKMPIVWVEAEVHEERNVATTHRVVDFASADRTGKHFEEMIKKYGIPNMSYPHCNRELKLRPMYSYVKSLGWENFKVAIGMRADEPKRLRKDADDVGIIYPLAHWWSVDKQDVNDWWEDQPFTLQLLEHQGNCKWCWKKSEAKHLRLISESPEIFEFPRRMEESHATCGANAENGRVFFRKNRSTNDLFRLYAEVGSRGLQPMSLPAVIAAHADEDAGCGESCDINMEIGTT